MIPVIPAPTPTTEVLLAATAATAQPATGTNDAGPTMLSGPLTVPLPTSSGVPLTALTTALDTASPTAAVLVTVYLMTRLLIPAILIAHTTRDASPKQRIALLRDYLLTNARRGRRRPR